MKRTPVESSNVASIGYDPTTGTLEVEFTGGSIYQYHGVPPAIHGILMDANSKGTYLARAIKPHFAATKVTEGEKAMAAQQVPSIGRIVHYRLREGRNVGQYRPAIIVNVWTDNPQPDSRIQLQVFTDSTNDDLPPVFWATSIQQGEENGQYIWPPYVAPKANG